MQKCPCLPEFLRIHEDYEDFSDETNCPAILWASAPLGTWKKSKTREKFPLEKLRYFDFTLFGVQNLGAKISAWNHRTCATTWLKTFTHKQAPIVWVLEWMQSNLRKDCKNCSDKRDKFSTYVRTLSESQTFLGMYHAVQATYGEFRQSSKNLTWLEWQTLKKSTDGDRIYKYER